MAFTRVAWRFPSDDATVSALTSAAAFPAANLQLPHTNEAESWMGDGTSAVERIVFDFGEPRDINFFATAGHNLDLLVSGLTILANDTDTWGSPSFSQPVTFYEDFLIEFFDTQAYRFLALEFDKASAAAIYWLGRMVFGTYYEFEQNVSSRTVEIQPTEDTSTSRAPGGQSSSNVAVHIDGKGIGIEFIPEDQKAELELLDKLMGLHSPFFLSLDHDTMPISGLIYGKQVSKIGWRDRTWINSVRWDASMTMVEEK